MTEPTEKKDNRRRVTKTSANASYPDIGKMPPQAVEMEEAVLGALMLEKDAQIAVIDLLKPETFYKDVNSRIFSAIQTLSQESNPIDIMTVTKQLMKTGELEIVGGAYYITQLTNRVASAANAEFHARVVIQEFIKREMIRVCSLGIKESYEEGIDVFDLIENIERGIYEVASGNIKKDFANMSTLLKLAIEQVEKARKSENGLSGIPTGLTALDRLTSGWQKSDLVIIAARPAMGKTALVLTMARNAAVDFGHPVAVFSLEMSSLQLTTRLMSSESELPSEKLKKGTLEEYEFSQLNDKIKKLAEAPIYIDDTAGLSIFELRAKSRRLKEKKGIELIIVDYLQLMTGGGQNKNGNREQEISFISRSLKGLAKELDVPVIALSQLSRAVETRGGDKRPVLSDLRESGAIEQDADMVMFIHRPEYYHPDATTDKDGNDIRGVAELIVAKHRNGPVDSVKTKYVAHLTKFMDLDDMGSIGDYSNSTLKPNTDFNKQIHGQNWDKNDIEDGAPF